MLTRSSLSYMHMLCQESSNDFFTESMEINMDTWKEEGMDILIDEKLKTANTAAIETGRLTPLIKEELWTKIQARRLSEGKTEMTVNFKIPLKVSLSKEEERKADLRRERNRLAARKCRTKKKSSSENVVKVLQEEQRKNTRLKEQVKQLELEKEQLLRAIRTPACSQYSNWLPVHSPETTVYQPEFTSAYPTVTTSDTTITTPVFSDSASPTVTTSDTTITTPVFSDSASPTVTTSDTTMTSPEFSASASPIFTTADSTTSNPVYLIDQSDKLFPFGLPVKDDLDMDDCQVVPIDSMMYSFSM